MTERPSLFPPCPEPTADLAAAPPVATTLFVTGATKGFDRLAGLEGLRCLYVREISQPQLEIVAGMAWLEALSIFIYRGASLAPLRRMKNLRGLSVTAASKIDTLADIAAQTQLEELGVGDLKLVRDIDRKSTRLNSSHIPLSRMPSSA